MQCNRNDIFEYDLSQSQRMTFLSIFSMLFKTTWRILFTSENWQRVRSRQKQKQAYWVVPEAFSSRNVNWLSFQSYKQMRKHVIHRFCDGEEEYLSYPRHHEVQPEPSDYCRLWCLPGNSSTVKAKSSVFAMLNWAFFELCCLRAIYMSKMLVFIAKSKKEEISPFYV